MAPTESCMIRDAPALVDSSGGTLSSGEMAVSSLVLRPCFLVNPSLASEVWGEAVLTSFKGRVQPRLMGSGQPGCEVQARLSLNERPSPPFQHVAFVAYVALWSLSL